MLLLVCARLFSLVELLLYIRRKVESGKLSPDFGHKLEELYYSYQNAILQSGNPNAHEVIRANMAVAFDRMLLDAEDPFILPPLHKAIREPFDYYKFGQNYIRPLVDFRNSYVGSIHLFQEMEQKLEQGLGVLSSIRDLCRMVQILYGSTQILRYVRRCKFSVSRVG